MTKDEFQAVERQAARQLVEAVETAEALLKASANLGIGSGTPFLVLDPEFIAAGAAFQAVIDALGSGAASQRAKLDKIR